MTETSSYVYSKFLGRLSDRLSYGENHPERAMFYKKLEELRLKGVNVKELVSIATPIEDTVNPSRQFPDQTIAYLGLEGIESNTGRATFRKVYGKDILSTSKRIRHGNLVFVRLRPYLNKAHLVEIDEAVGSGELFVVKPNPEEVVPMFLLKYLLSGLTLTQTKWILTGCSYPRLDIEDFKRLLVILPDKDAQKRLLMNLGKMEEDVKAAEKEVEKLDKAIIDLSLAKLGILPSSVPHFPSGYDYFTRWANHTEDRLDFVWNHPTSDTIRALLDEKKALPLAILLDGDFDYGINASGKETGAIPFVNVENLNLDGEIHSDEIHYVDEEVPDKILREADLLISRSRTVGTSGYVGEQEDGFTFGSYVLRGHLKTSLADPLYIVNYINSSLGQAQITYLQSGSRSVERGGGNNINPTRLKQLMVILPPSEVARTAFCNELKDVLAQRGKRKMELAEKIALYNRVFQNTLLTAHP